MKDYFDVLRTRVDLVDRSDLSDITCPTAHMAHHCAGLRAYVGLLASVYA